MSRRFLATVVVAVATAAIVAAPASAATDALTANYRTSATGATTDQVEPWFTVANTGTTTVPLAEVTLRYYFRGDTPDVGYRFACSWAVLGCANVTGTFRTLSTPTSTADRYLEVGFTSGAGSLAPGANTGDLQLRFYRTNWGPITQSDDYSFTNRTTYAAWNKVTVQRNGTTIWGTGPGGDRRGAVRRLRVHVVERRADRPARLDRPLGRRRPRRARRGVGPVARHVPHGQRAEGHAARVVQQRVECPADGTVPPAQVLRGHLRRTGVLLRLAGAGCRRRQRGADVLHDHAAQRADGPELRGDGLRVPAQRRVGRDVEHPVHHHLGDLPGRAVGRRQHPHRAAHELQRLARPGDPGGVRPREVLRGRQPVRRPR